MQIFIPPEEGLSSYGGRHHIDFLCFLIVFDSGIVDITFPLRAIK